MSERKQAGETARRAVVSYTPKLKPAHGYTYPSVSEFMDKSFIRLRPEMPIYEAIRALLDHAITGATVVDEHGRLIGILSEKDCLRVLLQVAYDGLPGGVVRDYMSSALTSIPSTTDITQAASVFLANDFRRLPVVDGDKLVGQITRRDLLRAIRQVLREGPGGD